MSPLVALAALALLCASAHGKPAFALPQLDLAGDPSLQDHDVPSALLQDPYSYYLGDGQVPSQAYGARPLSAYSTGEVYPLSAYFNEKVHPLSAYSYENAFPLSAYSGEKVIPVGAYSNKEEPFYTQHKLARPLYSGVQVVEVPVQVPVQVPVPVPVPVPVQVPVQVVRRPVPVVARPIHVVHPVHVVRPDRPVYHNVEKPEEATVSVVEEAARPEAVYNETVQQPEEPHPQEITPEVPSEKTIKHEDTTVYHIKEVVQEAPVKEEIQVIEKNVVTQPQETTVYQTTVLPDETVGTYNLDAVSEVRVPSKTVIDTTSGTESVYQTAVASSQQTEQSSTSSGVSQYAASSQGAGSAGLGLQGSTGLRLNAGGLGLGGIGFNAGLNGGLQGGAGLNAGLSGGLGFNAGLNGGVRSGLGLSAGAGGSGGIGFGAGLNGGGLFGANTKGSLFG